mgnify:CR=1 FL=1
MHAAALVFLEDPTARRLAVAWHSCRGDRRRWFRAAGFDEDSQEAAAAAEVLVANAICRAGGVTDALALGYVAREAACALDRPARKTARREAD